MTMVSEPLASCQLSEQRAVEAADRIVIDLPDNGDVAQLGRLALASKRFCRRHGQL